MNELKLFGKHCRDIVSGMEGICTGVTEWMYGCQLYKIQPRTEDGKKKESYGLFYEKQLEVLDDGITDKVEIPEYTPQQYFGKKCKDKVTGVTGICVGRSISLFSGDQYVLEIQPEDLTKESRVVWLDEGRMECLEKAVEPKEVQGKRTGGVTDPAFYPPECIVPMGVVPPES